MKTPNQTQERTTLPRDGMSRFKQFQTFLPVSRETWRKLVNEGKAPVNRTVKLSQMTE